MFLLNSLCVYEDFSFIDTDKLRLLNKGLSGNCNSDFSIYIDLFIVELCMAVQLSILQFLNGDLCIFRDLSLTGKPWSLAASELMECLSEDVLRRGGQLFSRSKSRD